MAVPPLFWNPWLWPLGAQATLQHWWDVLADGQPGEPAPGAAAKVPWTTPHAVALDLEAVRLLDFSLAGAKGTPTLVVAPFALHGATLTDLAPGHSLIGALRDAGLGRLFLFECKSTTSALRYRSIDAYLADLNVAIDHVGGAATLVGLCQGGWLSLVLAARFPAKVSRLVIAGAPVDLDAASSRLVEATRTAAPEIFTNLIAAGGGIMHGSSILALGEPCELSEGEVADILQVAGKLAPQIYERFRCWNSATLDLPGTYYLDVVERLFRANSLAKGGFVALGQPISLGDVHVPLYVLAGRDDDTVPAEQALAATRLVGTPADQVAADMAPCVHLSLFMGARTLKHEWQRIVRWIVDGETNG
jgi:poly(3-hydroxyalkanoate) synthetase